MNRQFTISASAMNFRCPECGWMMRNREIGTRKIPIAICETKDCPLRLKKFELPTFELKEVQ
jgi:predicted RNA-binding Zn-ribbon protein involved in translation (DUF1610 family)